MDTINRPIQSKQQLEIRKAAQSLLVLREAQRCPNAGERQRMHSYVESQERTWLGEMLDGQVRTDVPLDVSGGDIFLINSDGVSDWTELHQNGLDYAKARANEDNALLPYIDMAMAELEEALALREIVRCGEAASILVISPCGEDVIPVKALRTIGRNPEKQRAFVRLSVFDGQQISIHSRSVDLLQVEQIVGYMEQRLGVDFGEEPNSSDIQRNRIVSMGLVDGSKLADEIKADMQSSYTSKQRIAAFNLQTDTHLFIEQHQDLWNYFMASLSDIATNSYFSPENGGQEANDLRYKVTAKFRERMLGIGDNLSQSIGLSIVGAGARAAAAGIEFAGCDTILASSAKTVESMGLASANALDVGKHHRCPSPGCGKFVKLDARLVAEGVLHCSECKLTVDVCGTGISFKAKKILDKMSQQEQNENNKSGENRVHWWTIMKLEVKQKQIQKRATELSKQEMSQKTFSAA